MLGKEELRERTVTVRQIVSSVNTGLGIISVPTGQNGETLLNVQGI